MTQSCCQSNDELNFSTKNKDAPRQTIPAPLTGSRIQPNLSFWSTSVPPPGYAHMEIRAVVCLQCSDAALNPTEKGKQIRPVCLFKWQSVEDLCWMILACGKDYFISIFQKKELLNPYFYYLVVKRWVFDWIE